MARKSIDDIYREVEDQMDIDCYETDSQDLKLKDQKPYALVGKSLGGNILLKVGDELGYDVSKVLTFSEALRLINALTVAVINKYTK
jgi:predicted alpha/beta-fold hydrolase